MINERTNLFYMANLGSEFMRVFSAYEKKDMIAVHTASIRAIAIADTLLKNKKSNAEEKEITILKEILTNFQNNELINSVRKNDIEAYFQPFALRMMSLL